MPPGAPSRSLPRDRYLSAALDYAAAGLPVFLLGRTKRPVANCRNCPRDAPGHDREACPCLTCHGFYAATTDPARVHAMFEAIPDGLLALRTGAASGRLVVDVDPRNGGRIDHTVMSPTATVGTGDGGWHLHYAYPGRPVGAKLRGHPGVDIKADGGYVLLPPSVHPVTRVRYRWVGTRPVVEMPPPLLDLCLPPSQRAAAPVARPATVRAAGGISHPDRLLAAHIAAVDHAPEGTRRHRLYGAARGVARLVGAGCLTTREAQQVLTDAGRRADQTDRDIRAAIVGGFRDEGVPL